MQNIKFKDVYTLEDSLKLLRTFTSKQFDETIELNVRLNLISGKKKCSFSDEFLLPHKLKKDKQKVAIFVEDSEIEKYRNKGAFFSGNKDLVELIEINKDKLPFDICISTSKCLKHVQQVKNILSKHKKLPTLRNGLLTNDLDTLFDKLNSGAIKVKNDKFNNLNIAIGKLSFKDSMVIDNIKYVFSRLVINKPKEMKYNYILKINMSSTHSKSISITL